MCSKHQGALYSNHHKYILSLPGQPSDRTSKKCRQSQAKAHHRRSVTTPLPAPPSVRHVFVRAALAARLMTISFSMVAAELPNELDRADPLRRKGGPDRRAMSTWIGDQTPKKQWPGVVRTWPVHALSSRDQGIRWS